MSKEKLNLDVSKYNFKYICQTSDIIKFVYVNYFKNFMWNDKKNYKSSLFSSSSISQWCSLHSLKSLRSVGVKLVERENIL
jgi:hypothetical protein